jgi:hypothetical protein
MLIHLELNILKLNFHERLTLAIQIVPAHLPQRQIDSYPLFLPPMLMLLLPMRFISQQ